MSPSLAALVVVASLAAGLLASSGGLVVYWTLADHIEFRRLGYRIRPLQRRELVCWSTGPKRYVYEERRQDGSVQTLPFVRVVTAVGYPSTSSAQFPDEGEWDTQVPAWARARRTEIVERVDRLLGNLR